MSEKALKAIQQGYIYTGGEQLTIKPYYNTELKDVKVIYTFTIFRPPVGWHKLHLTEENIYLEPQIKKLDMNEVVTLGKLLGRSPYSEIAKAMGYVECTEFVGSQGHNHQRRSKQGDRA